MLCLCKRHTKKLAGITLPKNLNKEELDMKLNDSTDIINVTIINMADGVESKLFEIKGSRCHFHKEFNYQDYIIQLRLDWGDVAHGEPVLDADIWCGPKNKKNRLRNGPWHHAEKVFDSACRRYIYIFKFENLKLRLGTKITAAKNIKCDVRVVKPSREDSK